MKNEDLIKMVIENSKTLSRLEEKQDNLNSNFDMFRTDIMKEFSDIKENYVTKKEFMPVKSISYGIVGTVLTIVLTALVYTLIL